MSLQYPLSRQADTTDTLHGVTIADPYRWLEALDAEETVAWVAAQNRVTFKWLNALPHRDRLRDRLSQLWNYPRYSLPFKKGNRYFYRKNDGLQNQSVLYVLDRLDGEPRTLLDPNLLSDDGTVALGGISVSPDGRYLAYSIATSGSDWQTWLVRDVETVEDNGDRLDWIKFSGVSWARDNAGFFYSRYDQPDPKTQYSAVNTHQKLYYHRLGTSQAEDVLVYERPDHPDWGFAGIASEDGRYLVILVWLGTDSRNLVFYRDLTQPDAPIIELVSEFTAKYTFVDSEDTTFYLQTNADAPSDKLIAWDLVSGDRRDIIAEGPETLESVSPLNGQFVACYLKDAHSEVRFYQRDGQLDRRLELPGLGSVWGFYGDRNAHETFYAFTNFTTPTTIYRYDCATGSSDCFRRPAVPFSPEDYASKQVFYTSKDGTRVPMFLTYRKGLDRNGQIPTYLYGYGGFNIPLTPSFSVSQLAWLELGGLLAIPNLRGGGEYGEAWHQAGMKAHKQTVFDDFIAAAEWLIAAGYTNPAQLAIGGGSNGGLLVGACLTQRPELFAAAFPQVGVLDMLRFHQFTIGWAWCSEYGTPDDPDDFKVLRAYSPLHNLQPGTTYPATLIVTADRDDRVVPAHSFKFAAALQAAHTGDAPVLIRIETKAGHGAGKPTNQQIEAAVDCWAFIAAVLGIREPMEMKN
ncbi:MAG: prolyl oligopeptidase family serine peptidase [Cyanobacteria bacterium P01_G01_bin.54]